MGGVMSVFSSFFWKKKDIRVLILGLDNAGKTTILYRLKTGDIVATVPTIGFNLETVKIGGIEANVWDLGGQASIRPHWRCYYTNTAAIIFVIDSTDVERLSDAKEALLAMLDEEELKETALLVLANKQDLKEALSVAEISKALGLASLKDRNWSIFPCKAIDTSNQGQDGQGLEEGMRWLANIFSQL